MSGTKLVNELEVKLLNNAEYCRFRRGNIRSLKSVDV